MLFLVSDRHNYIDPTLRLRPISHTRPVKRVFLNKHAQSRLSTDNDSVMSDDGESDE
jgi:hypothetical protein